MAAESVGSLEQEIAATRDRLNGTIERIQDKLTVSGLVDEVMGQAGVPRMENGHDFVLGLLRRHPIPVMIAAAGIGFMLYRSNRRSSRSLPVVEDVDFIDVPVLNTGHARIYDPDLSPRHPSAELSEARRGVEAQA